LLVEEVEHQTVVELLLVVLVVEELEDQTFQSHQQLTVHIAKLEVEAVLEITPHQHIKVLMVVPES
jgi:hypothetical protein